MTDEAPAALPSTKPPKGRSPSYPGISLATAIDQAKTIYDYAQQHPVPLATITGKWGYKAPTTGPASVTYAALKKFGLLEDEGTGKDRTAHLTDLAVEILHSNPNQADAIKRAALRPGVIREWWDRYKLDLPPDESLRWEYVVRGQFTETGLSDFLRVYKETVTFAKLAASDTVVREDPIEEEDPGDDDDEIEKPPRRDRVRTRQATGVKTYAIPVDADHDAVIELPTPMTTQRWENFKSFLNAMERIIVDDTRPGEEEDEG